MLESCNVSVYSTEGYPDIIFQVMYYGCVQGPFFVGKEIESEFKNTIRPVLVLSAPLPAFVQISLSFIDSKERNQH